jgi:ABC-type multidrug transport system ATPase subunit
MYFHYFPGLRNACLNCPEHSPVGQQMLAIGRALMSGPQLLMLDEPSLGIAPMLVEKIFEAILAVRDSGMTVLLVEQHVNKALSCADYGYILQTGRMLACGTTSELRNNNDVKKSLSWHVTPCFCHTFAVCRAAEKRFGRRDNERRHITGQTNPLGCRAFIHDLFLLH